MEYQFVFDDSLMKPVDTMLCLLLLTSITKLLSKPEKKYGRKCRFSSASLRLLFLIYFIAFICISIYHPFPLPHFVCMFV